MEPTARMLYVFIDSEEHVYRILGVVNSPHIGKKLVDVLPALSEEGWSEMGRWPLREQQGHYQVAFQSKR